MSIKSQAEALFLKSCLGMLKQGKKSMIAGDPDSGCAYKSSDGSCCAIGFLMDFPFSCLEAKAFSQQKGAFTVENWKALCFEGEDQDCPPLGESLQRIHDDDEPDEWFDTMEDFASLYGFDFSSIDEEFGS